MSANALSARFVSRKMTRALSVARWVPRVVLAIALSLFAGTICYADSNEPQPTKTTLPADFDTTNKYTAHAPLMSDDERNMFYLKWGLIFVGGTGAVIALAIWLFSSGGKEEAAPDKQKTGQATGDSAGGTSTASAAPASSSASSSANPEPAASQSPHSEAVASVTKESSPSTNQDEEKSQQLAVTGEEGAGI